MNDTRGHLAGDEVLREVVSTLKGLLRREDVLARLGGDEFALLLPGAGEPEAAAIMKRLQEALLETMRRLDCGVTFSVGLVTFEAPPRDPVEAIHVADGAAYEVKRSTKGAVKHLRWTGEPAEPASPDPPERERRA